ARYFSVLIVRHGITSDKLEDRTLFKASLAFHYSGDHVGKRGIFNELERRAKKGELDLGKQFAKVDDVKDYVEKLSATTATANSITDSPMFRGQVNRLAVLTGGIPYLGSREWKAETTPKNNTQQQITTAETGMKTRETPSLPEFHAVTATVKR